MYTRGYVADSAQSGWFCVLNDVDSESADCSADLDSHGGRIVDTVDACTVC